MDDHTFEDLKDAYVLGALPKDERAAFEGYLAAHPERQAEIDDLVGLVGLLALAPPEHETPVTLRARVMDVVEAEGSTARRTGGRTSSWFNRLGDFRNAALAAAALLLVGLVSWNLLLQGDVRDLRGEVDQARGANAGLQQDIELAGAWSQQGTRAEVAALDKDRAILIVEDMPSMPEDRTLQVWVIEGDNPEPSGLLDPAGNMAAAPITTPLNGAAAIAVTVEPAGGSDAPTTDPVLLREL